MTVGRLLNEISSYEITEWMAYFKVQKDPKPQANGVIGALKGILGHRVVKRKKA